MSIIGKNFKYQEVSPLDDGRLYSAIFNDGVLYGLAASYAGYTLTLAPGYLMACGRLVRVSSVQNFAASGATEGFARVVLTIDLTSEASITSFQQITAALEYALIEDDFAELTQQDINDGVSTLYQLELARVTLGASGITGIVSTLGKAKFKEVD